MKKIFIITLVLAFITTNAQIVPNGGFEETYFDSWGNTLPKYWKPNFWGMILDTTAPIKPYKGDFAQVLQNRDYGNTTIYERKVGSLQNRFKLNCLPLKANAFVQYWPFSANEKFLIKAVLFNRNNGESKIDTVAVALIMPPISSKFEEWTKFEASFEYYKNVRPDSAELTIYTSLPEVWNIYSSLAVDEIDFSDTVQALSIGDEVATNQQRVVDVYPNPANNTLFVKINIAEPKEYTLTVYDISGRELFTRLYSGTNHPEIELNTAQLSTGAYLLKVTSGDAVIVGNYKFLVSKP